MNSQAQTDLADEVLARLRSIDVVGPVHITQELVGQVLRTWDRLAFVGCRDLVPEEDDGELAWETYARISAQTLSGSILSM